MYKHFSDKLQRKKMIIAAMTVVFNFYRLKLKKSMLEKLHFLADSSNFFFVCPRHISSTTIIVLPTNRRLTNNYWTFIDSLLYIFEIFIFRLTPVYAFVVFYYSTVFNYIGSGPMWKIIVTQQNQACRENWYLNLLYLNNYIGEQNMVS